MTTTTPTEQSSLFSLFQLIDDIRRDCLKKTPLTRQKKLMGLSVRQASALSNVEILTRNEPQGIALKTLAQNMQMTVPATSLLVENMVTKGFLERTPNPYDRRAVCIRISADGEEFIQDMRRHVAMELAKSVTILTPAEHDALESIVQKLVSSYYEQKK